jgi:hypothetical protein
MASIVFISQPPIAQESLSALKNPDDHPLEPGNTHRMTFVGWRTAASLAFSLSIACPPAGHARTATEALTKGQSYVLPALTYCTSRDAVDALVALRQAGDLDSLPPGCFSPDASRFSAEFNGFIPDHKVSGITVPEKLSHPNRFGKSTCTDPQTGAAVNCVFRVIRSGFVEGIFVGAKGSRTPAFIEVANGIEVMDPRSGELQFAPLAGQQPTTAR